MFKETYEELEKKRLSQLLDAFESGQDISEFCHQEDNSPTSSTSYFVIDENRFGPDSNTNDKYAIYSTVHMDKIHRSTLKNAYTKKPLMTLTYEETRILKQIIKCLTMEKVDNDTLQDKYLLVDMLEESPCELCDEIIKNTDLVGGLCPSCYKKTNLDNDITRYLNDLQGIYEFDETYSSNDATQVPKYESGIYVFTNKQNEVVYVGQATDLRSRVNAHLLGATNTKGIHRDFHNVTLLYMDRNTHKTAVDYIEKDIIQIFNPKYNKMLNKNLERKLVAIK